jgi:hypothetical protein
MHLGLAHPDANIIELLRRLASGEKDAGEQGEG